MGGNPYQSNNEHHCRGRCGDNRKKRNILLAADNTFATPFLQSPLDLSADIVMHSVTKYIAGHSDVIMVALICKGEDLAKRLYFIQKSSGAVFAR